jgi:predicted nucleic acid-binding Zn ribbon protein
VCLGGQVTIDWEPPDETLFSSACSKLLEKIQSNKTPEKFSSFLVAIIIGIKSIQFLFEIQLWCIRSRVATIHIFLFFIITTFTPFV